MASDSTIEIETTPMENSSSSSDQIVFLHGDLELKIIEARRLPNMDLTADRLRRCFAACTTCEIPRNGKQKRHHRNIITSDPYVTVSLAGATVARTRVIPSSQNPVWDEEFNIPLAHPVTQVQFQVKDDDVFGAQLIGTVSISAKRFIDEDVISDWFPVIGSKGKPPKPDSALRMEMKFTPFEKNPLYHRGIGSNPDHFGVRNTYFPIRKGGLVTLYQDAHVPSGLLPEIELDNGKIFRHESCWEDICHAILEAHHLIYIVGWSIYHKVKLIRESNRPLPSGGDLSLGDLLKYKSQEGVRVLLLVWDDKTSHDKFFINTPGVMATHDEETRKFFKHSSVICALSPRYASSKLSIFKQKVVGSFFTHHQKIVLVDTQASGNNRKISAFLGGLDLCDGRYDTPEHRLFRDLDTVFENDFHNPTFPAGTKAPRQPWHDMHCRIEGPAAYDVLTNFEQRWRKATKWSEFKRCFKKISHSSDDALIKLERISWILTPSPAVPNDHPMLRVSDEQNPENWHVQVFRSIDSGSVKGFPTKNAQLAKAQNLVFEKNLMIDQSIQTGYIQAIRSAQHFIYIENQYFLGSSYAWPSYKSAGADNLIPMELALKIVSKIRAKERFAVYIVIPMWPEGIPSTNSVQEVLYWQHQTMQMMYELVAKELKSAELETSHPQDYLNFYCLGNREPLPDQMSSKEEPSASSDKVSPAQKFRRFMIYVHAKGMIVDDEYVILGSANINQRSLAGSRDTEIAMGAYQPHHTWGIEKKHPRGQVYGYRMSLWSEHLGIVNECFKEPQSLDCVKYVNSVAEDNWRNFVAAEVTSLQGHLLKYPVMVDSDGKVKSLPEQDTFPDIGGKIIGVSTALPDALTS